MLLSRVLAASLALLMVVGCSTHEEKSEAPKAEAPLKPTEAPPAQKVDRKDPDSQESPASRRRSEAMQVATPPRIEPAQVATPVSPPERKPEPSPKAEPLAPPDPWAGISAERKAFYEQLAGWLGPIAERGGGADQAIEAVKDKEQRARALMALGQYKVSLSREAETSLRAVMAQAKDTEAQAEEYLTAVDRICNSSHGAQILAAVYEKALDEGADISPETRRALGRVLHSVRDNNDD